MDSEDEEATQGWGEEMGDQEPELPILSREASQKESISPRKLPPGEGQSFGLEMSVKAEKRQSFGSEISAKLEKRQRRLQTLHLLAIAVGLMTVVSMFVVVLLGNELSKDTKPAADTAELRTLASNEVVKTGRLEAYSTLAALPCQSAAFLDNIRHVTLVVDGVVRKYTIENFAWRNATSMELYTTLVSFKQHHPSSHSIVIRGHKAYVDFGDGNIGHVATDTQVGSSSSRRKQEGKTAPRHLSEVLDPAAAYVLPDHARRIHSWEGLIHAYKRAHGERRRLDASGGEALFELYRFFGGLVGAEVSPEEDEEMAGTCGAIGSAMAPLPDLPLQSKWAVTNGGIAGTWYMDLTDLDSPRFHLMSHLNGTIQHEVAIGGSKSTFWAWDKSYAPPSYGRDFSAAMASVKGGCVNEPFSATDTDAAMTQLDVLHEDGSATWKVAGWLVTVTASGSVSSIADVKVVSVEEFSPADEGGGVPLFAACIQGADEFAFVREAAALQANTTGHRRRINAWSDFQTWASGTNWCSSNTDRGTTPCPTQSNSNDYNADRACRRHDHSARYSEALFGAAGRLACDADDELRSFTGNPAVQALYGSWGLSMVLGCYDIGRYSCWKWNGRWWGGYFSYGSYCSGETVKLGPFRYSQYSHHYGYEQKTKSCAGDIW